MTWPNQKKRTLEREAINDTHYLTILKRIQQTDFSAGRYAALGLSLGGEQLIKERLKDISLALKEPAAERVPLLKKSTEEMLVAIRCFAESNSFHTGTPGATILSGFIKGEEVDEHMMLRIISHCLFVLNFKVYELEKRS